MQKCYEDISTALEKSLILLSQRSLQQMSAVQAANLEMHY